MHRPSCTPVISGMFLGYIAYAIYSISLLFQPPICEANEPCLKSFLHHKSKLQLHMFVSPNSRGMDIYPLHSILDFNYSIPLKMPLEVELPSKTRQNGTLFLYILIVPKSKHKTDYSFNTLIQDSYLSYIRIKLTQFIVPAAETFNLLGEQNKKSNKASSNGKQLKPVSHLRSSITFNLVTDAQELSSHKVPSELRDNLRVTDNGFFLPIINYDFLQTRHNDLVKIVPEKRIMNISINYNPTSMGILRLIFHVKQTMEGLKALGFSDRDVDEVKGIYADTNLYLLGGTIMIAALHLLFDFLSFKNDIHFWRSKGTFEGLSVSTIIWRGFSQTVIFFYLLDEGSSLLVLIPAGIGSLIEMWKIKKVLKLQIVRDGTIFPTIKYKQDKKDGDGEMETRKFDAEFMQYLSYLLYPLVIAGAIYSLIYQPHKSWYSWTINSMVNGVYAFGFLFMLPQLFVNYKLKSVAHLPWRAFMYKAFNTFIDDIFAFIITMPTAHRVACFRDDAIFLVYLYQRWLYPVDKTRRDTATIIEEPTIDSVTSTKLSDKKKN